MIETYTLAEAAAVLDKSEETIRRWAMAGQFEYTQAAYGHSFRVSKPDIDALAATAPEDDLYITPKEAGRLLTVSQSGIAKMAKNGKLTAVKWCNNWYVLRESVLALRDSGYDAKEARKANGYIKKAVQPEYTRPPVTPRQIEQDALMAWIGNVGR